ncbi:MAG: acylneuraminate cytidylyltransferase family protein [Candidatus Muirbacterium halophilum]|nr:acylneuraminate cytidylyltransferase family protein [Candidatus Muirbacterium halophilum]MCK9477309.1 acylneuraminate cytidylyltransferase family protein [Candidatus Muirbacterium halophilum]
MHNNKTFLAIIPARGGSKRLPRKNTLDLAGKPLIAWSIEAGLKSKYIDEVMVSTDDDEIINIAKNCGARIPFVRPKKLSNDFSTRSEVIKHTIEFYQNKLDKNFDYLIFLQPTSPLRDEIDIDKAIEYLFCKNADAIVSVCEVGYPIQWSGVLPKNNDMSSFLEDIAIKSRSQDFKTIYKLNGALYICSTKKFLEQGCLFLKENIYAYKMLESISVDIDTKEDFEYAEFLMNKKIRII